jgi:hypothetical protein
MNIDDFFNKKMLMVSEEKAAKLVSDYVKYKGLSKILIRKRTRVDQF